MKRVLLFVTIIAAALTVVASSSLEADTYIGWGRVLNSRGDPLPVWPVDLYIHRYSGSTDRVTIYTDYRGHWQYPFTDCRETCTACALGWPHIEGCVCVFNIPIECEGPTAFPDLVIPCGGPKEPPCPHF